MNNHPISAACKARGITRSQLAREIGSTAQTLYNVESGLKPFGKTLVERISTALDVSPAFLMGIAPCIPVRTNILDMPIDCPIIGIEKQEGITAAYSVLHPTLGIIRIDAYVYFKKEEKDHEKV